MSEANAKTWIIDAVQDFIDEHHTKPTRVRISISIAHDLLKLGRNDIGEEMAEALFRDGIEALKGRKLFGYHIEVDPAEEEITCE